MLNILVTTETKIQILRTADFTIAEKLIENQSRVNGFDNGFDKKKEFLLHIFIISKDLFLNFAAYSLHSSEK